MSFGSKLRAIRQRRQEEPSQQEEGPYEGYPNHVAQKGGEPEEDRHDAMTKAVLALNHGHLDEEGAKRVAAQMPVVKEQAR